MAESEPKKNVMAEIRRDCLHDEVFKAFSLFDELQLQRFRTLEAEIRIITTELRALEKRHDQRFTDSEKSVNAALAASDKAVNKAEEASTKRFESVNEFRATLADQAANLMPRPETDQRLKAMEEKIARVEKWQSEQTGAIVRGESGKNTAQWIIGLAVVIGLAIAGIIVGVMTNRPAAH